MAEQESRTRLTARKINVEDVVHGNYYKQEGFDPNYVITRYGLRVSRGRILGTVVDTYINDDESYGAVTIDDGTETIRAKFFQDLDMMQDVQEGDIVEVVGKVKEYNDEIYVNPELILKRSPHYELLRALELEQVRDTWREYVERVKQLQDAGKGEEDLVQELKGEGLEEPEINGILQFLTLEDAFESAAGQQAPGANITKANTHPTVSQDADGDGDDEEDGGSDHRGAILEAIEELDEGDGADYSEIVESVDAEEDTLEDAINDLLSDGTCYEPRPGRIKKL